MQLRRLFDPTTDHDIYQNLSDPWFLNKQVLQKLHLLGCQTPQDKKLPTKASCCSDPRMVVAWLMHLTPEWPESVQRLSLGSFHLKQTSSSMVNVSWSKSTASWINMDQHGSTWINMDQHGHGRNGTHWTCFKQNLVKSKLKMWNWFVMPRVWDASVCCRKLDRINCQPYFDSRHTLPQIAIWQYDKNLMEIPFPRKKLYYSGNNPLWTQQFHNNSVKNEILIFDEGNPTGISMMIH